MAWTRRLSVLALARALFAPATTADFVAYHNWASPAELALMFYAKRSSRPCTYWNDAAITPGEAAALKAPQKVLTKRQPTKKCLSGVKWPFTLPSGISLTQWAAARRS